MSIDVLDNDDGVIHDQADGKHQRQQRQQIDRVAEGRHQEECAYQRQRHGHHGDDDCPQCTQEQVDHHCDDNQGLNQCLDDLLIEVSMNIVAS